MLDAYIIEELRRRRDEDHKREQRRPVLELPVDDETTDSFEQDEDKERSIDRPGVIIIDYGA